MPPLAVLIGGFQIADSLQIQNPLVVRSAFAGLGQNGFGFAVGVAGIVQRGQFQAGLRIIRKAGNHIIQYFSESGFVAGAASQQIEEKAITLAILGIGLQAGRHQVGKERSRIGEERSRIGDILAGDALERLLLKGW